MATFFEKNKGPLLKEVTLLDSSMNFIYKKKTFFVKYKPGPAQVGAEKAHSAKKTLRADTLVTPLLLEAYETFVV